MSKFIVGLLRFLANKTALAAIFFLVALSFLCLPALVTHWVGTAEQRAELARKAVDEATDQLAALKARKTAAEKDIAEKTEQIAAMEKNLDRLNGFLEKLRSIFNRAEREKRVADAEAERDAAIKARKEREAALASLNNEVSQTDDEIADKRQDLERAQELLDGRETTLQDLKTIIRPRARIAAVWTAGVLIALFFGPSITRIAAFYTLGRWAEGLAPVVIDQTPTPVLTECTSSAPALKVVLRPGDEMVAKEEFLQGNKEGLAKSTCWLWQWHYPLTSFVTGLRMLTRITYQQKVDAEERTVTISNQEKGITQIAMITIPEGESLVFRPSFLAAMVYEIGKPPKIRSHWIFRHLHAWVTLQFRYFVITGPVRILFRAGWGVHEEVLISTKVPFRINRKLTIGFSPALQYRSRRAETLMAYLRGKNPLFDDYFSGAGKLYSQQTDDGGDGEMDAETFWSRLLSGVGKIFGL